MPRNPVMTLMLAIWAAAVPVASPLTKQFAGQPERLHPNIAAADRQKYKSINDAKLWRNPYLVIKADGIEVISRAIPSGRKTVQAADLVRTLIDLPVDAWPYGKVVAVQDTGIRAADRSNDEAIRRNHEAVAAALESLAIEIELWPSA